MKLGPFIFSIACFTLLTFSINSTSWGTLITFDDLNETGSGAFFSYQYQGYQGLIWSNILCNNAVLFTNVAPHLGWPANGLTGDYYGMVSPSNVASVITGEIDSPGTNFNFLSAHLTGFGNSNLNIEVQGFRGGSLLYDTTVVASATSPTLFTFDYLDVDRLYFNSFGGEPAFGGGPSYTAVMDDLTIDFVPEPSSLLLAAFGALLLCPLLKRKRA